MQRPVTFFIICLFTFQAFSQNEAKYFKLDTDNGQYLIHGKSYLLDFGEESCFGFAEEIETNIGKKYDIIKLIDEQGNRRGVMIFNKKGDQINFEKVQSERAKYYEHSECCIFVSELKNKLIFWDYKEPFDEALDYDCYYDSQTDASDYLIPRYYIFDPKTNKLKTIILKNTCTNLIMNNKIICD